MIGPVPQGYLSQIGYSEDNVAMSARTLVLIGTADKTNGVYD
jgi:hypothetical protein